MTLSESTVRRLALIRLLLQRAEELGTQPAPYSSDAVNRAHDVAEMWLALVVEHLGLGIPKDFMAYWPAISAKLGRPLGYNAQMTRLNKARVALKHYGVEPAANEVTGAVAAVRALLTEETPQIFGSSLDQVTLLVLMRSEAAATLMRTAEANWSGGKPELAFADLRIAFEVMLREYLDSKSDFRQSVFSSVDTSRLRPPRARDRADSSTRDTSDWMKNIVTALEELDQTTILIGLGVDLRRYGRFSALTPHVRRVMNGDWWTSSRTRTDHTTEEFEFCWDFIVQTGLYLAE